MENVATTDLVQRILRHYRQLLRKEYVDIDDAISIFSQTKNEVVELLLPYALKNNFWWEKADIEMAYYQMKCSILVVNYKDFRKYFHKLMGIRFNELEFNDYDKRKKLIEESERRYKQKKGR